MRSLYDAELCQIGGGHGHEHDDHELPHIHMDDFHGEAHSHAACGCRVSVNSDVLPLLDKGDKDSIAQAKALLKEKCSLD